MTRPTITITQAPNRARRTRLDALVTAITQAPAQAAPVQPAAQQVGAA